MVAGATEPAGQKHPSLWVMVMVAVAVTPAIAQVDAEAGKSASKGRPPNVIFILADDWGWGDLGCYGHAYIRTPNLDRLARQGTRFTQFYVCSGVCSPSRTAFLTGQFPARHRIHGHLSREELNAKRGMPNYLDPAVPTVARLLKEAGYATGHFGKWHLGGSKDAPLPTAYGFDEDASVVSRDQGWDWKDEHFRARLPEKLVDKTLAFIDAHRDRPFYAQMWMLMTHATLHPTDEQLEGYKRFSPNGVPYHGATQIYYASATSADRAIGRLLDQLDAWGLAENTMVVFSSDNGPEDIAIRNASHSGVGSAGPFRGRKRSLYEGGVRVPFIVRWPGATPAGRVDNTSVIAAVDWLPTLCSLARIDLPQGYGPDGEDVSDSLRGRDHQRRRPIMWEWRFRIYGHILHRSPRLSIREGPWKLLMNPDRSRVELYHIPEDPSELDNRAVREPEVVERLASRVTAWAAELPEGPVEPSAGQNDYPWPR